MIILFSGHAMGQLITQAGNVVCLYELHSELKLVTVLGGFEEDILGFCNLFLCTHSAVVSTLVYSSYNWGCQSILNFIPISLSTAHTHTLCTAQYWTVKLRNYKLLTLHNKVQLVNFNVCIRCHELIDSIFTALLIYKYINC